MATSSEVLAGFAFYTEKKVFEDRDTASRLAALAVDGRWPKPFQKLYGMVLRSRDVKRRLARDAAQQNALETLLDPSVSLVRLDVSATQTKNLATLTIETGTFAGTPYQHQVFCAVMISKGTLADFVQLAHAFAEASDASHGVITTRSSYLELLVDVSGDLMVRLGDPIDKTLLRERKRLFDGRPRLGRDRVRHARWGNYYSAEQLTAIGGIDKLRSASPFLVQEVGRLTYVQMSDSPTTGADRLAGLNQVLEPILV